MAQRVDLRAMTPPELGRAIRRPLEWQNEQLGRDKRWQPELVVRLVEDTAGQPTLLPLLQVAQEAIWGSGRLTLDRYRTLTDALEAKAEAVYSRRDGGRGADRPAAERRALMDLLLDLVSVSLDDDPRRDVRRTVPKADLVHRDPERARLVDELVSARLLSTSVQARGDGQVEVVDIIHETLLHNWERLRAAVQEQRRLLQQKEHFHLALQEWIQHARSDRYLLHGIRLAEARECFEKNAGLLNELERTFLKASRRAARRRLQLTLGGLTSALLVISAFALIASWQGQQAEQQRARAERRFADVRQLANSFLFEFHDAIAKLPGATPARQLVVQRAMTYLDGLAQEASGDPTLQRELAVGYTRVADVQGDPLENNLGDVAGALRNYQNALTIFERLVQADPSNAQVQRTLAANYDRVGGMLRAMGDMAGVLASYRQAQMIRGQLTQADPTNAQIQRDLAISYERVGEVQQATGDVAGALASYEQALTIRQNRLQADPTNTQVQQELAVAYRRIGLVQKATGDTAAVLASYRQALTMFEQLRQADPTNAQVQRDLTEAANGVCWIGTLAGAAAEVLPDCERAVTLADGHEVGFFRDSRGLARALTGDVRGAIEDFSAFVEWAQGRAEYEPLMAKRRTWMAELEAGRNPFDAATIYALRAE
jgi:tetratricopeptide (TPR) repeat protein